MLKTKKEKAIGKLHAFYIYISFSRVILTVGAPLPYPTSLLFWGKKIQM
jgi:hypothetical protein